MKLVYTDEAIEDLKRLREFIAVHNPSAAGRIATELVGKIEFGSKQLVLEIRYCECEAIKPDSRPSDLLSKGKRSHPNLTAQPIDRFFVEQLRPWLHHCRRAAGNSLA